VLLVTLLTVAPAASMGDGGGGENNMYNFENMWGSDKHSADKTHTGWPNLGGWECDGTLHDDLEPDHVPNAEHPNCDNFAN